MKPEIDRLAPTRRPSQSVSGYHRWSNLGFLHWRISPELIRPFVPAELELDLFEGDAWVGLVPFTIPLIRIAGCPRIPYASSFHETNLRTYVHWQGKDPGVWFFSLDAANRLAVWAARRFWYLNYVWASMELLFVPSEGKVTEPGGRIHYKSWRERERSELPDVDLILEPDPQRALETSQPGSLEYFLAERYILYSQSPRGSIYRGQVHHKPYELVPARDELRSCRLFERNGLPIQGPPEHVLYSPGVDVEVFPMRKRT